MSFYGYISYDMKTIIRIDKTPNHLIFVIEMFIRHHIHIEASNQFWKYCTIIKKSLAQIVSTSYVNLNWNLKWNRQLLARSRTSFTIYVAGQMQAKSRWENSKWYNRKWVIVVENALGIYQILPILQFHFAVIVINVSDITFFACTVHELGPRLRTEVL